MCYVHGTKYVVPECSPRTQRKFTVQVFDFNQYAVKHAISQGDKVSQTDISAMSFLEPHSRVCVTGPSIYAAGDLFQEEVRTFLPYRWIAKVITTSNETTATLCSEDSIIVIDDDEVCVLSSVHVVKRLMNIYHSSKVIRVTVFFHSEKRLEYGSIIYISRAQSMQHQSSIGPVSSSVSVECWDFCLVSIQIGQDWCISISLSERETIITLKVLKKHWGRLLNQ